MDFQHSYIGAFPIIIALVAVPTAAETVHYIKYRAIANSLSFQHESSSEIRGESTERRQLAAQRQ